MDIAVPLGTEINSVDFTFLTTKDIKKLSVKQVSTPDVFDSLGHPISGGLYDLAMGAFLRNLCATCGLDDRFCPGHIGHIELPTPVYNPLFFSQMYMFLRSSCLYCQRFRLKSLEVHLYDCRLRLLQHGLVRESMDIVNMKLEGGDELEAEEGEEDDETALEKPTAADERKYMQESADLRARREQFVTQAIAKAIAEGRSTKNGVQTSSILEKRKACIHEFYKRLLSRPKCDNCGMYSPKFRKDGFSKIFEQALTNKQLSNNRIKGGQRRDMVFEPKKSRKTDDSAVVELEDIPIPKARSSDASRYVLSTEIRNILRAVFRQEQSTCKVIFQMRPDFKDQVVPDMFFIHCVVVPPTRFRLPSQLGDEIHANAQNDLLAKILTTSLRIRDLNEEISRLRNQKIGGEERKYAFTQLMNSFVTIQNDVNAFLDSTKNQNAAAGKVPLPGIKQALEKKEGLFRKNMMGKRVNYAARSVISPDPNIETNEIGLPPVFAVKLTYPEPITDHNFHEMRAAVINGPNVWPGATQIQNEDGSLVSLQNMTLDQRTALANQLMTPSVSGGPSVVNKKVFRHIKNSDVVLMNRQPTLHKASMMGHKVRVLPKEKTLRLHYANTGAYNADFDGDEMNLHFPQNEGARAEALLLANTDSQYLTPTSGKPLRGLIQDHISAGVWLTNKDAFFTRDEYQQLIYGSVRPEDGHTSTGRILTVPPTIYKPVPLWTGKQVITTVLLNIKPLDRPGLNLKSKNKIKNEYWGKDSNENEVVFRKGELISGILDKSQYGAADYGFVHSIHEIYGQSVAGSLLSVLGRLFTKYIMKIGFTCGMDDLWLTAEGNEWRRRILDENMEVGLKSAAEVTNLPEETTTDHDPELLERLEEILRDDNKSAILDAISQSKVGAVTSSVISKCIPEGTEKRFPLNNMQAMALSGAKGSNVNVSQIMCLLGQQALEGRRVPVMVSGKTLPSFKPFETSAKAGGFISGRFFSGIKPQEYYFHCMAGREGLIDTAVKTSRSGYLQRCLIKKFEGISSEYDNTVRDSDGSLVQFMYGGDGIDVIKESHLQKFDFCVDNYESLLQKHQPSNSIEHIDTETALSHAKKLRKHNKKHPEDDLRYDPTLSLYNPSKYLGAVSEEFEQKLDKFISDNADLFPEKKDKKDKAGITEKKFRSLMQLKYMQSIVNPGDAVGIIASQSIGEPSTQMTLNTFHFAGHGAANVTLGIPRMREIIMTASQSIKTPQMVLPILKDISDEQADVFCRGVAKIVLSEIIDNVIVTERTGINSNGNTSRSYTIKLQFYTSEEYENEYDVTKDELQRVVSRKLLLHLERAVVKEVKKQQKLLVEVGSAVPSSQSQLGAKESTRTNDDSAATVADEDDDNEDDEDSSDVEEDDAKATSGKQSVSYDDPDDEEIDVMEAAQKSDDSDDDSDDISSFDDDSDDVSDSDEEMADVVELTESAKNREKEVVGLYQTVRKYNFDDKNGEWCEFELEFPAETKKLLMVNVIEQLCQTLVVREVPRISRCIRPAKHDDGRVLVSEGVNFGAMWDEDMFIDVNGILSNDIYAVLKTYGVEAARNTIVREINNVFKTYAIAVNMRHLDLIGDLMTQEGTYLPFNRQGVDSSTSPFMKMSFETTCGFLTKAVLEGDRDTLDSPSARIVTGKFAKIGTGKFDVFSQLV